MFITNKQNIQNIHTEIINLLQLVTCRYFKCLKKNRNLKNSQDITPKHIV